MISDKRLGIAQDARKRIEEGLNAGLFTAAAYALITPEGVDSFSSGTTLEREADGAHPINPATAFDLASLTKPLCAAVIAAKAIQYDKLRLDATLRQFYSSSLPVYPFDYITLADLLRHTAGFKDWTSFFENMPGDIEPKAWYLNKIFTDASLLVNKPATVRVYSDIGYIMLGIIFEEKFGAPLDSLMRDALVGRFDGLHFNRIGEKTKLESGSYPATGYYTSSNSGKELLQGVVNDENSRFAGGVTAHAGLFGTAQEIANMLESLILSYCGDGGLLRSETARQFMSVAVNSREEKYCLAFDVPTGDTSTAGEGAPRDCIGHLGFTGTSFWISPEARTGSVLLTNRVHCGTPKDKINAFRRAVHGLAWRLI